MNSFSFIIACLSGLSFVIAAVTTVAAPRDPAPRWRGVNWVAVGLALFILAWVLSVVLVGGSHVTIGAS